MTPNGVLTQAFVPELAQLREAAVPFSGNHTATGTMRFELRLAFSKSQFLASLHPGDATAQQLKFDVLASSVAGSAERVGVTLDFEHMLFYSTEYSSDGKIVNAARDRDNPIKGAPILDVVDADGTPNKDLVNLHMIVDHSIITIIVNNRGALTVFANPSSASVDQVRLPKPFDSFQATLWPLRDVYPAESETTDIIFA
jgi:hypothetical protein